MGGVPCIRGLRIPVATVMEMMADGMTSKEILGAFPDLEAGDISSFAVCRRGCSRAPATSCRRRINLPRGPPWTTTAAIMRPKIEFICRAAGYQPPVILYTD